MHGRDGKDDAQKENGKKDEVIEGTIESRIDGKLPIEPVIDEANEGDKKNCEKDGRGNRKDSLCAAFIEDRRREKLSPK